LRPLRGGNLILSAQNACLEVAVAENLDDEGAWPSYVAICSQTQEMHGRDFFG
jgi:hypothetical protein